MEKEEIVNQVNNHLENKGWSVPVQIVKEVVDMVIKFSKPQASPSNKDCKEFECEYNVDTECSLNDSEKADCCPLNKLKKIRSDNSSSKKDCFNVKCGCHRIGNFCSEFVDSLDCKVRKYSPS